MKYLAEHLQQTGACMVVRDHKRKKKQKNYLGITTYSTKFEVKDY